jgi:hypothetical protein
MHWHYRQGAGGLRADVQRAMVVHNSGRDALEDPALCSYRYTSPSTAFAALINSRLNSDRQRLPVRFK